MRGVARVRLGRGAAAGGNGSAPADAPPAWFEKAGSWRVVAMVAVGCVTLGYAFLLYHHRWDFGRVDLEIYRGGTKIALDGESPYGDLIRPLGPFLYPPFAVILMSPLTLMPLKASQSLWALVSMASFATTMWLVVGKMRLPSEDIRRPLRIALIAVGFCLAPIWLTLIYGQVNIVLMALIALDVLVDHPRWPRGLLVGLAVAIKLTPAVFVAWFLLTGRRREALVAIGTFVVSVVAGLLLMGGVAVDYWTDIALELPKRVDFDHVLNQSAYALMTRFEAPEPRALALVLALPIVAVGLWRGRAASRADDDLAALAICGSASVLLAPVSWVHHSVWVTIAAACLIARALRSGDSRSLWKGVALAGATVIYFSRAGDWWIREMGWMLPAALVREWFFLIGVGIVLLLPYGTRREPPAVTPHVTGALVSTGGVG